MRWYRSADIWEAARTTLGFAKPLFERVRLVLSAKFSQVFEPRRTARELTKPRLHLRRGSCYLRILQSFKISGLQSRLMRLPLATGCA